MHLLRWWDSRFGVPGWGQTRNKRLPRPGAGSNVEEEIMMMMTTVPKTCPKMPER